MMQGVSTAQKMDGGFGVQGLNPCRVQGSALHAGGNVL